MSTAICRTFLCVMGALLLLAPAAAAAQETSGTPAAGLLEYQVAIFEGTCDELGAEPAYELGVAEPAGDELFGEPDLEREPIIVQDVPPTTLATAVDVPLADLVDGDYVIAAVDDSLEERETVVCSPIEGTPEDGRLQIDLEPTEGSAVTGYTVLQEQDGQTAFDINLFRDIVYVTAVPVDLQPEDIVVFGEPTPGAVQFVIFNQRIEGESSFIISGPGIEDVLGLTIDAGYHGYLSLVLEPGTYTIACPECGEFEDEVVESLVVEEALEATPAEE